MFQFLTGAVAMGYVISALFFLRYWRETADRLFLIFACAFVILGIQRTLLSVIGGETLGLYVVRLIAFLLILAAIVDKNRKAAPR